MRGLQLADELESKEVADAEIKRLALEIDQLLERCREADAKQVSLRVSHDDHCRTLRAAHESDTLANAAQRSAWIVDMEALQSALVQARAEASEAHSSARVSIVAAR